MTTQTTERDRPGATRALSRLSLPDQAVEVLREMIASGTLDSGDRINEVELAAQLGISRGPLREAIARLGAEGLIELRQNRGAYVRSISLDDLGHMYEVRQLLEVKAASLAAILATEEEISELHSRLSGVDDILRGDAAGGYPTDFDFHELVLTLSGNPYLRRAGIDLQNQARLARVRSGSSPERARQALAEHHRIIAAIARRDASRAAHAMAEHLRNSLQHLIRYCALPRDAVSRAGNDA
jgi:DNA-binding GntR family transcriptional regulator